MNFKYLSMAVRLFLRHILTICLIVFLEMSVTIFGESKVDITLYVKYYILDIAYFYVAAYGLLPVVFDKFKSFSVRILCSGIVIGFYSPILLFYNSFIEYFISGVWEFNLTFQFFYRSTARGLLITIFSYLYHNAKYQLKIERENFDRQKRNIAMENDLLRAQVDPHLINNVLSVLYDRVEVYSKEDAEIIRLLSSMTSHSISPSDKNGYITLEREIENIRNYIRIIELCREQSLNIQLECFLSNNEKTWLLPPNILLEPVINLLKYGDVSELKKATISINVSEETRLFFSTFNFKYPETKSHGHDLGLRNLIGRLDTNFPNKHKLSINDTETSYEFTLTIDK